MALLGFNLRQLTGIQVWIYCSRQVHFQTPNEGDKYPVKDQNDSGNQIHIGI